MTSVRNKLTAKAVDTAKPKHGNKSHRIADGVDSTFMLEITVQRIGNFVIKDLTQQKALLWGLVRTPISLLLKLERKQANIESQ